ncbi:GGDEF domain-containing protein [uncultured Psychromonas sp.]|uniref:GGDEF domain-containing protein n=1 Tax=uncultured Psychromonas sp. TaxID=173974 RepID=UPI00261C8A5E|nr:GGDEF domain-containing protein [uncultured Psychromonas sp.]
MRKSHFHGVANVSSEEQSKIVGKTVEVEGLRKSGDTFPLSLSVSTWVSKRGRIFCGILRDISLRVEAAKKITEQNKQLQLISVTDPLTGAFNRRQFDLVGDEVFARSSEGAKPYTILMLDIDHFKVINDIYGHALGDKAIIETVSVIKQTIRQQDSLFRLGGEEFAIILPETSLISSKKLAERIRISIEKIEIPTDLGNIKYTISIGVAAFSPKDESITATLKNADEALYRAKSLGRNRVE